MIKFELHKGNPPTKEQLEKELFVKIHIGDIPTKEQLEKELFKLKILMLQTDEPQEQKRLSDFMKSIIKDLKEGSYKK